MILHRRAGAARASEGHCRGTSADVSVCTPRALRPSDFFFLAGKGPLISQECQDAIIVFLSAPHTLNITLSRLIPVCVSPQPV